MTNPRSKLNNAPIAVRIVDMFPTYAVVIDQLGKRREIPTNSLPWKGAAPEIGERWVIEKSPTGYWYFSALIGVQPKPKITGCWETDAVPIMQQVLAALGTLGLVNNQTTVHVGDTPPEEVKGAHD